MSGVVNPYVSPYVAGCQRLLGLEAPNPRAVVVAPPTVMASPPTVTLTQTSTSSMANPVSVAQASPVFRFLGGNVTADPDFPFYLNANATVTATPAIELSPYRIEFEIDTAKFDVVTWGKGSSYRIQVDGQLVSQSLTAIPSDGARYIITVDFGARAQHRLTIEGQTNFNFGGLNVSPTDTVWATSYPKGPRVIVVGDSFGEGTGASYQGFPMTIGDLLGWRDLWVSASGGTGYREPGTRVNLQTRAQADVVSFSPDIVIVCMGINDANGAWTQPQIQAAVAASLATIRAGLPSCKLFVVGPWSPGGSPNSTLIQTRDSIKSAGAPYYNAFIDNIGGTVPYDGTAAHYVGKGWMTGTGKNNSHQNDGNADIYTSNDGTHPTQAGHDYLGRRIASAIAALMPI
jgi:lysophospholipase L1-like esterase